jgi:hypothetical protein
MVDTLRPPPSLPRSSAPRQATPSTYLPGPTSCMARELRMLAEDMAGRLDRDAVPRSDERDLADALDAAVTAVLPQIAAMLDAELAPRLEGLPLHTRLALGEARRHHELGFD